MKKIILGSDWWTDCDDAVAIRLLCNEHKKGTIELLGIALDACMEYSVPALSAFMTDMQMGDIPIGVDIKADDFRGRGKFQERLSHLPKKYKSNEEAEEAVLLYRRLLAESDEKVDIVEIGFPQVLAQLVESAPDKYSSLNGAELIKEKVNALWFMAGKWDEQGGREHNFCNNARSINGGIIVLEKWPADIIMLGWEVGNTVITGGNLPEDDQLKMIMNDHGSNNGRSSWDPMTALLCVTGDVEKAGYCAVRGTAVLDEKDGANYFTENENGNHYYVIKKYPDEYYADMINGMIKYE